MGSEIKGLPKPTQRYYNSVITQSGEARTLVVSPAIHKKIIEAIQGNHGLSIETEDECFTLRREDISEPKSKVTKYRSIDDPIVPDDELVGIWDEETDMNEVKTASEWVLGFAKPTVISTTCY